MAFNIKFYKISDAPNVMNKDVNKDEVKVGNPEGYNCTPWEPVGVLDGSVVLGNVQAIGTANYAYISGGTRPRYAFVTGYEDLPGNQMRVYVKEDALMTFSTEIKKCDILATRASVAGEQGGNVGYNSMLEDGMWKCDSTSLYWLSVDLLGGQFNYDQIDREGNVSPVYVVMTAG